VQPDEHPCSKCPILDLGHRYPVRDPRDPWRRMPKMFQLCVRIFGPQINSHESLTRLRLEKLFGHYCKTQRSKYGPCTKARTHVCARVLLDAVQHGHEAPDRPRRYAYVTHALRTTVNDDSTHLAMKETVVAKPEPTMTMPPITFREVPAA
jgi:hypothetical protein